MCGFFHVPSAGRLKPWHGDWVLRCASLQRCGAPPFSGWLWPSRWRGWPMIWTRSSTARDCNSSSTLAPAGVACRRVTSPGQLGYPLIQRPVCLTACAVQPAPKLRGRRKRLGRVPRLRTSQPHFFTGILRVPINIGDRWQEQMDFPTFAALFAM